MGKVLDGSAIIQRVNEKNAELAGIRTKIRTELQDSFKGLLEAMFNEYPILQGIAWTQYTPYFNDGEPCVFNMNDVYYTIDKDQIDDMDLFHDESWTTGKRPSSWVYDNVKKYPEYQKDIDAYNALVATHGEALLKSLESDISQLHGFMTANEESMEAIFGDHVRVVATRDGIDVQEYEHE